MKNNWGFTLIELLVVTALMLIMAAIFFPKLDEFLPSTLLRTTGRRLTINIRYLAQQAILKQKNYRLYLDPETNTYWSAVIDEGEPKNIANQLIHKQRLPANLSFRKIDQPAPFSFEKKIPYIEFLPNGEVEQTLIVLSSNQQSRKLNLLVHTYGGSTETKESEEEDSL